MLLAFKKAANCALLVSYLLILYVLKVTWCCISSVPLCGSVEGLPIIKVPAGIKDVSMFNGPRPMFTVLVSVQVCPPTLKAKLAVPLLAGVPVIIYVNEPAPIAKLPAAKVAVKPVTPIDVTVCPLCEPPFPPV